MNWRRAKNLLLVSFLLLDLALAWLYQGLRAETMGHAAGAGVDPEIVKQLGENNITLATELPRGTPELALLRVGVMRQNPYPLALTYFGTLEGVNMVRLDNPLLQAAFSRDEEEVLFYSSGVTVYTRHDESGPAGGNQSTAEAEKRAHQFLVEHGGLGDLQLLRTVPYRRQGTYLVEYTQNWQGRPLVGASGAVLVVTPTGVENCWRRYLTVLGESGIRRSVVSSEAALLALALDRPRPEVAPMTIKEITLGYYNKIYNADEWEAAPVWRFWTGGDHYYYVNAFTGEMEAL